MSTSATRITNPTARPACDARVMPAADPARRLLLALNHTDSTLLTALSAALGGIHAWQIVTVDDLAAARRALRESPFDAVVGEMCGAAADVAAMMQELRSAQPQVMRILLCGSDSDAMVRALSVAQRVLPTPCHAARLGEAVARADALRSLLGNPRLQALLGSIEHLPSPPRVYLQMTAALNEPGVGANDVGDIVACDPALAAAVLRLCNSAFFSTGRPLTDLRAAVMRLGTRTLRHLVLACEAFAPRAQRPAVDPDALQRQSLLASVLAPLVLDNWAEAELARVAALLAQIGLLLPALPATDGARPAHAEAGAALLAMWGLPEAIVEAVAFNHDPGSAGDSRFGLVGAVHVAVALAGNTPVDEDYLRKLGLHDRLREWRKLLSELSAMV